MLQSHPLILKFPTKKTIWQERTRVHIMKLTKKYEDNTGAYVRNLFFLAETSEWQNAFYLIITIAYQRFHLYLLHLNGKFLQLGWLDHF